MSKTCLVIARHGNTFAPGEPLRRVGITDLPLVESGIDQGRSLGIYLRQAKLVPDAIFTSRLKRTIQTAEAAQAEMGTTLRIQPMDIFDEIDYGPDENILEEAAAARIGEAALKAWNEKSLVPSGWNVDPAALVAEWKDFAADMLHTQSGNTVLVVTSNGIARFAPHLTGDFEGFRAKHSIKLYTGALCLFENDGNSENWTCPVWNLRP